MNPTVLKAVGKSKKDEALKFAKVYSKTFKNEVIVVEDYPDAEGVTVWRHHPRMHDGDQLIGFVNGVKKRC